MTLVEVAIGMLVLAIMVLGSAYYRYLTVLDIEKARHKMAAVDLAVTLIETWQGAGGASAFDPADTLAPHLSFSSTKEDPKPAGYKLLGAYEVTMDDQTYRSTLYWKDVMSDLRELGTVVSWPLGHGDEQRKAYQLTTYVRR